MPRQTLLFKNYMTPASLPLFETAYEGIDSDFLIYAGYEKGDFCYWRPERLGSDDLHYLEDLQKRQKERWQAVDSYNPSQLPHFPLIKCFGPKQRMEKVSQRLKATQRCEVAFIRDPYDEVYHLLLVTDQKVSKGESLKRLFQLKGRGERVIAAGDDENDLSLLQTADTKIAMAHAPASLQQVADFIAPPTKDQGIIHALQMALHDDR
jgi:hydroxymethylpyrimidine pyrophosphatase-like HAD family hydrolase